MKTVVSIYFILMCFVSVFSQENIEQEVETLLAKMTLEEKIGQMTLYTSSWDQTGPTLRESYKEDIRSGRCGNIFNAHTAKYTRDLQRIAVEETRLGIPLLFGYDVIHGYKTIFPIPLAEACSWDMGLMEKSAKLASKEAAAGGLHWTFAPMVDICRDPRWGRISEGSGEDPFLGSEIARARVKGFQGNDLSDPFTLLACIKHFAAYGASQAGRDYHTVDLSKRTLMETYFPPYKAGIDAGAATVMTSFNEVDGVPASGSSFLLKDVLRKDWGFEGFVVTDYTSINEMIPHGFARDEKHAGELALHAGVDMDMQGAVYQNYLAELVKEGKVSIADIDEAVRRILTMKHKLGLFKDPYKYSNEDREKSVLFSKEMIDHSRDAARKSIVLLKNEPVDGKPLLPLSKEIKKIALIGPLGDNREDVLGSWHAAGDVSKVKSILEGIKQAAPKAKVTFVSGCSMENDELTGLKEALVAARDADVVIMAVGENYRQNGEAASRSNIDLPGRQKALMKEIHKTGKPIIAVVMAGRPLTLDWEAENIPAILNAWHLGTMAGPAIADVLFGEYNPSGKLVITFPRNTGQIPIYYAMKNTGRPFDANNKYTSKYLDVPNEPLYAFGHGLSYTTFTYSNLTLDKNKMNRNEEITVNITVTNSGKRMGEEVIQLYIRDLVGSVTRPVKELKGYQKISIAPGESRKVKFTIKESDLRFYTQNMDFKSEPGMFEVYVGGNSVEVKQASFELN